MKRTWLRRHGWMTVLVLGPFLLGSGCELPPNFWSEKAGEIVNRSIFGVINAVLAAVTGGAIQI